MAAVFGMSFTEQAFADSVKSRVSITTQKALGPPQNNWNVGTGGQYVPHLPDEVLAGARNLFAQRFAGMHFWRGEGREPVLRLVDPTPADVAAVAGVLQRAELAIFGGDVAIVPSHLSERARDAAVSGLANHLGPRGASVSADPVADVITVQIKGRGPARKHVATRGEAALLRRLRLDPRTVRWVVAAPARDLSTAQTGTYGSAAIQIKFTQANGLRVTHSCTSGFAFTAPSGTFMSMAGHCAQSVNADGSLGTQMMSGPSITVSDRPSGASLGWVATSTGKDGGDIAAYTTGAKARQWIGPDKTYYVLGAAKPQIGEWVCFNGSVSGRRCGRVFEVSNDGPYESYFGVTHQFCIGDNGVLDEGQEGDSGSAMWVEDGNNADLTQAVRIRGVATMLSQDIRVGHLGEQVTCGATVNWMMQAWGGTVVTESPPTLPTCSCSC